MAITKVRFSYLLTGLVIAVMLAACDKSVGVDAPLAGTITVDGSTTLYPLSKAMAEAFRKSHAEVQFSIDFSGTGGGFKKFCAGKLDIAGASRPINSAESEQCKAQHIEYIEVPVAFDSLAVVVNAQNGFADCLTVKELKAVWEPAAEGKMSQWSQIRGSFPSQPLVLFGPGKDSGTFDYFTLAIVGTQSSSRSDYTKSEDDMVIERGVAGNPNALGYLGYAYYQAYKDQLRVVAVDNGRGCVLPSAAAVSDGTYQPLSRPLFTYINVTAAARPEVKAFALFYVAPGSVQYTNTVGYVPLPTATLAAQASRIEKKTTGSVLGEKGSVTGITFNWFDDDKERDRVRNELVQ